MNFFKRRPLKEEVKTALKNAQHARNMREDICSPEELQKLDEAVGNVETLWKAVADDKAMQVAIDALHHQTCRIYPPHPQPKWHENTEVLVVALGAAMAIRAYFFQPFKIPTGSMQPTLNGILHEEHIPDWSDKPLIANIKWAITGQMYKAATGMMKIAGDHVIVNKFWYNFMPPKRGDVVVFDTAGIKESERQSKVYAFTDLNGNSYGTTRVMEIDGKLVDAAEARPLEDIALMLANRHNTKVTYYPVEESQRIALTYYIKRMVGEPGDKVSVDSGYLVVNDEKITAPYPFERQVNEYGGYTYAGNIPDPSHFIQLADDEFLPFGDNSANSLDGRYFTGVKCKKLLGPAFMVYWPFGEHWGKIR